MNKIVQYFLEVKAELGKVVWPAREQVIKNTGLVIVFSLAVAIVLGAADYGFTKLLQEVIN